MSDQNEAARKTMLEAIAAGIGPRATVSSPHVLIDAVARNWPTLRINVHLSNGTFRGTRTGVYAEATVHKSVARARRWAWEPHKPFDQTLVDKIVKGVLAMMRDIDRHETAAKARRQRDLNRASELDEALVAEGLDPATSQVRVTHGTLGIDVEVHFRASTPAAAARLAKRLHDVIADEESR